MKYFIETPEGFECNDVTPKNLKEGFEKSIEKWTLLAEGKMVVANVVQSCGLCNLYYEDDCINCPIYKETEQCDCNGFTEYAHCESSGATALPVLNKLKEWQRKYVPETKPKTKLTESSILFYPRKDTNQVTVQFIHNGDIHTEKFDGDMSNALYEVRELLLKEETADFRRDVIKSCFADPMGKESK